MVIVTGSKGQLSLAIRDHLEDMGIANVKCLSLREDTWEKEDFREVDAIVHVAGIVPKEGVKPEDYYSINTALTAKLAQKAKNDGVRHFVYISSMSVYGLVPTLTGDGAFVMEETPCRPTTDYGKSKLQAEHALEKLQSDKFRITIIRVPSIYNEEKTEYFSQYQLIIDKFRCIPIAFQKCLRSAIYLPNLCELVGLVIKNKRYGVICPDDGPATASDYCRMIAPRKFRSRIAGLLAETLLRRHPMIAELFGTVAYHPQLADVFGGSYRKYKMANQ